MPTNDMTPIITIALLAGFAEVCRRSTRSGILVLMATLPLYLVRMDIGPLPTNLLELGAIVLIVSWLIESHRRQRLRSVIEVMKNHRWISLGTGLMILGSLLGLIISPDPLSSLSAIKSFLVEPILIALIVIDVETREQRSMHDRIRPYLIALSIPVIVASVVAIIQVTTGSWIPEAWALERRATGIFPYPNALGHFVAPIVTVLILLFTAKSKEQRATWGSNALFIITIVLGAIGMVLSETEAAWVAVLGALILASLVIRKTTRNAAIGIVVLAGIILAVTPGVRSVAIEKLTLQDWSGQTRFAQWEETWNYLSDGADHFILGTGMNTYPLAIEPYHTHDYLEIFQQPHNIILTIWTELGLVGLIGFLLFAIAIATRGIRHLRHPLVIPLFAALLEMTIHGLVDVPYFKNDLSILTWVIIGLLLLSTVKLDPQKKR